MHSLSFHARILTRPAGRRTLARRLVPALIVISTLAAPPVAAQETTGIIEGAVTDRTRSAVGGARVTVTQAQTGLSRETSTGPDGFFRLPLLTIGDYRVTVQAVNFATFVQ